jgi:hypothetical protein
MKAYEFPGKVTSDGKLEFSPTFQKELPFNQEVRIIVLVNETNDQETQESYEWSRLAVEQFFSEDGEEDAIYDNL